MLLKKLQTLCTYYVALFSCTQIEANEVASKCAAVFAPVLGAFLRVKPQQIDAGEKCSCVDLVTIVHCTHLLVLHTACLNLE